MNGITYREYSDNDIADVRNILENDLGYSVPLFELEQRIKNMISRGNYHIFVACDGKKVIGFIGAVSFLAFELKDEAVKVIALAVSKEYRHNGIGKTLLSTVENFCETSKFGVILINSGLPRTDAHKFYENQGYTKKSFGFTKQI